MVEQKGYNPLSMELTREQFERIAEYFPKQRGNVKIGNYEVLKAILYVAEQGCKWRGLPKRFVNWHSIYTRMNRWAKKGVLNTIFAKLQEQEIIRVNVEVISIDSSIIKVHPDGTGALKKRGLNQSGNQLEDGQQRFIWLPQMIEQQ